MASGYPLVSKSITKEEDKAPNKEFQLKKNIVEENVNSENFSLNTKLKNFYKAIGRNSEDEIVDFHVAIKKKLDRYYIKN